MAEQEKMNHEINGNFVTINLNGIDIKFPLLNELTDDPETGVSYKLAPEGIVGGYGAPVYGGVRKGKENKLAVIFGGGGVAWDEHMAARPHSENHRLKEGGFYSDNYGMMTDIMMTVALAAERPENPLRDWSIIFVPYNTGDFHIGTADLPITDLDGNSRKVHFHGYTNYRAIVEQAKAIFGFEPDELLVTGFSAGAFATALLTDDVMDVFPSAKKCWCVPDSAIMRHPDNRRIASEVWKAPKRVSNALTGDGFVLAPLLSLKKKRGSAVQILYICSTRDAALSTFIGFTYGEKTGFPTKELCDGFENELIAFVDELTERDSSAGVFLFDTPERGQVSGDQEEVRATQHTILMSNTVYEIRTEGKTVLEWLEDAMSGNVEIIGTNLLKKH